MFISPQTHLFVWLQEAEFYHHLHHQAVELLPFGESQTWLDIGCGPGLMTRLASKHGYHATGIDASPDMIRAAICIARRENSSASFKVGQVADLPVVAADVVSASSLLAVLPDKVEGIRMLWQCVRPGGTLLIIEPTEKMSVRNANQWIKRGILPHRSGGLRLWAAARQGRAVDPVICNTLDDGLVRLIPLLDDLVGVWLIRKQITWATE